MEGSVIIVENWDMNADWAELVGTKVENIEATLKEEGSRDIVIVIELVSLVVVVSIVDVVVVGETCMTIIGMEDGPTIVAPAADMAELKAAMTPLA